MHLFLWKYLKKFLHGFLQDLFKKVVDALENVSNCSMKSLRIPIISCAVPPRIPPKILSKASPKFFAELFSKICYEMSPKVSRIFFQFFLKNSIIPCRTFSEFLFKIWKQSLKTSFRNLFNVSNRNSCINPIRNLSQDTLGLICLY